MKRYYYDVDEFTPESDEKLGISQDSNDRALIAKLFQEFKLDPNYSESERFKEGIDYIGHLEWQLHHWEKKEIDWLNHTCDLFKNEL